ncbi:extracellular solute-binding protein [Shimia sp. NS0008-38b]|uniref:extracellular solute-binding protein n=1 Tax=Shimia sp. NS0008-38b TaxID=3127653 RepID=UPI003342D24A
MPIRTLYVCSIILFGSLAHANEDSVWFFTWHATIPPHVQEAFRTETGIELVVDTFSASDVAEAQLAAGGSGYDLAVVPVEAVARLMEIGALQELSSLDLKTPVEISEWVLEPHKEAVPGIEEFTKPFLWGSTGLLVDQAAVQSRLPNAPLDSWDLFFNPEYAEVLADCGISIVDSVQEVVAITLNYLGRDPNSVSEPDLDAAFAVLADVMPYATVTDEQFWQIEQSEVCLSLTWSSTGLAPQIYGMNPDYTYSVPREGSVIWADVVVMPANTERTDHSRDLIDFLMSAHHAADIASYALASRPSYGPSSNAVGVQADILRLSFPDDRRELMFMMDARSGAEKRELDKRWRRLQMGFKSGSR